jgi:hypothetical protein
MWRTFVFQTLIAVTVCRKSGIIHVKSPFTEYYDDRTGKNRESSVTSDSEKNKLLKKDQHENQLYIVDLCCSSLPNETQDTDPNENDFLYFKIRLSLLIAIVSICLGLIIMFRCICLKLKKKSKSTNNMPLPYTNLHCKHCERRRP